TMCPSYMVTLEEKHSTRGRARLLGEMIRGETITDGWKNEAVKEALDLCLACKGCKGECPVQVDMATYKAEFLSHYYEGRLRPRSAYTMGHIHRWARLASLAPGVVNALTHLPVFSAIARFVADVHSQRTIPRFASRTFKQLFRERSRQNSILSGTAGVTPASAREPCSTNDAGETPAVPRVVQDGPALSRHGCVILWPDTFNNHFHPQTALAAVEVLEKAGFSVEVPQADVCCGRPLYDWGMLDEAKALLRQTLTTLRSEIREGVPIVVLEPSCASVFREELTNFFPDDEDAQRLRDQTFLLSDFLEQRAPDFSLPAFAKKALVHGHCHHKNIMKMEAEESILKKMKVDYEMPETGCCGMAGAFGFEKEHYDVAMKCGERVLLPAVREQDKDTLIITDGFSCREQIAQTTERQALHLAEVIQMALHQSGQRNGEEYLERHYLAAHKPKASLSAAEVGLLIGAGALLTLGVGLGLRSWRHRDDQRLSTTRR
ncbi:MAG TPA: (Fe-S)-binding protein, partial [Pyrinomonadaceae bacterium]